MRLTLRVLLAGLRAAEASFDEIAAALRGTAYRDDAIKAARFVDVKNVVGVHYDTFGFIKIDHQKAIQSFRNAGMNLHLLDIGSVVELETFKQLEV